MKVNFRSLVKSEENFESAVNTQFKSVGENCLATLLQRSDLGFHQLPQREPLWTASAQLAKKMKAQFDEFVWVGIGGSSLGPKSIVQALGGTQFHFIENPDVVSLSKLNQEVKNWEKVGFIFVSKSGTTIETLALLDYFSSIMNEKNLFLPRQSVVITELKSSSLYDWACKFEVPILEIPLDVGGRFSVLSSLGQLTVGLLGKDIQRLRKGALQALTSEYQSEVIFPMLEFFIQGLQQKDLLTYFWYYADHSYLLGKWLEQLWAESLGKRVSPSSALVASVPLIALGANDQHSVLQQMMEAPLKKSVVVHRFPEVEKSDVKIIKSLFPETKVLEGKDFSHLLKTEAQAMTESQKQVAHHVLELELQANCEESLGLYFMTYQLIVGSLGEYLKIDAFNQPGVELGKIITKKMLS
ncbi:MAG: glucose-6-phosphate isomerase [Bdellovibrionaceae bacterium]|nr:glucose-6-phosphate isomerase [Pseudobdellovibrionaceae bacterium]